MRTALSLDGACETGIPLVDEEHRRLMEAVDELAARFDAEGSSADLLDRLVSSATLHFKTEEKMMREHAIDDRHLLAHQADHACFLDRLRNTDAGAELIDFIVYWARFHMLDMDRQMSKQLSLLAEGKSPAVAYIASIAVNGDDNPRLELLSALQALEDRVGPRGGGEASQPASAAGSAEKAVPLDQPSDAAEDLRDAIGNGGLVLHFQPQVSLHSGEIVGLEALVRWNHPAKGLMLPGQFIPLAEETDLIVPLGEWVIRAALDQMVQWRAMNVSLPRMAVNLSMRQFRHPKLCQSIEAALHDSGVPPHLFELELTEDVMSGDAIAALRIADELRTLGVRFALDDFGTGYSSLVHLSRFPIDTLKIDQFFVHDITTNPVNASIAVATIAMAHKLGKSVTAEGVETEGQMTYLRRHDCDQMQGHYFSHPLAADSIVELLRTEARLSFNAETHEEQAPCLLLVDDEPNILHALKRLLRREGYRILTAESAAQGLELLAANKVDVIVSDHRMPEMTGTEFLSRVKELYPDTIRIVLSGYSEIAAVTEAINRGAIYKYLSKPWQDEELKEEIRQAIRHQGRDQPAGSA